jgi:purine-binding chemotaxis protein CheW
MFNNKIEENSSFQQIVCFKLGEEEYGIPILQVQEILKLPLVTRLPKSADYIAGIIDLRGIVIPIVLLNKKFKLPHNSSVEQERAIVVQISGKQVGLAIDSVSSVINVNTKDIEAPPPVIKGISERYIRGIAKDKQTFVIILDIYQIFSIEEIDTLPND